MVVYGVALLSFCMLAGIFVGDLIGKLIGAEANVGGVGIAMLLLIVLSSLTRKEFKLSAPTQSGINFWNAMYIPIVVAMAARQDVVAALAGGWMAIIAGVAAVAVSFAVIPLLDRVRIGEGDGDDT
ncbi:MAG TPA: malonate transporter subunit MadL [Gammaproteobacteria bacterium]|nr:malonate transporter subunit MadL [Gammaproteobacteria bacterium]